MLLLQVSTPPKIEKFVGEIALPVLLVQVPFVNTEASPPIVVFVPATVTSPLVPMLLPPVVAVLLPPLLIAAVLPFLRQDATGALRMR